MLIVKLKGGLGNQLFQYAFGRMMSIKRGENLLLDKDVLGNKGDIFREYGLGHFNIQAQSASSAEVKRFKYPFGFISKLWRGFKSKVLKIHNISWNPRVTESRASYFDGFWQSYKYCEGIREQLLKDLTLKESIEDKYKEILKKIDESNSVSLHIRRGDYVHDPKTKNFHNICDLDYYARAIQIMADKLQNPSFFIFSDEIDWAKENLKIKFSINFVSTPSIKDYEEMMIMSRCKNNIIANSSFSWWAAWLNQNKNKIVVAPKRWFNNSRIKQDDIAPNSWIKI